MKIFVIVLAALAIVVMIVLRLLRGRFTPVSDIRAFTISLDVEKKLALFILLSDDGTINRMGSGTAEDAEGHLFIGKTDPGIFTAVCKHVTAPMVHSFGHGYQMLNPLGASCELTISFKFNTGSSNGVAYRYGSESEGPPKDVVDFVTTAVAQTDSWYEEFRKNALRRKLE